jgi:hypothetical protein
MKNVQLETPIVIVVCREHAPWTQMLSSRNKMSWPTIKPFDREAVNLHTDMGPQAITGK